MKKATFSSLYGLNMQQAELDYVDITPGIDTPLYIDPYALTTGDDEFSEKAHSCVVSFFQCILDAVSTKNRKKGLELLSRLNEPEETFLGVSKENNSGRGIGPTQASELYQAISKSRAATTGLLEDLSDFALFIPNIGRDKISDITTNVIRKLLIQYTQEQCNLYNIPMRKVSSGFFWCTLNKKWKQEYLELPVYDSKKILLVPKHVVRYQVGVDHSRFRQMFVLEFLQAEHLNAGDSFVEVFKDSDGKITDRKVFKKTVDAHYPKDKNFLADFSLEHPEVLDNYRDSLKLSSSKIPNINDENYDEIALAAALKDHLCSIKSGAEQADDYHNLCISLLSFLFFPHLLNPRKEFPINEKRKRIDILYTNGKDTGFFYRIAFDQHLLANVIHVECKNYTNEIKNPEIDQLLGRFDHTRGRVGLLMFRKSDDLKALKKRCQDVAKQKNGVILPIDDNFIKKCLTHVESNNRKAIDKTIDTLFKEIIS